MKKFKVVPYIVIAILTLQGCSRTSTPDLQIQPEVQKPDRAVMLITADGINYSVFKNLLEDGQLPNLQWMVNHGVSVEHAVSGYPSITYAQLSSIVTGLFPGHHDITGNKWFERNTLIYRNYTTAATYRHVDGDLRAETIYNALPHDFTVNLQCPVRKGVGRIVDNWMTSGILWFLQAWHDVDALMPARLELIAEVANETGRWPTLAHIYLPATDEVGHRYGADSQQYKASIQNVDTQIGRIRKGLQSAEMEDRTFLVFISDHGHLPVPPENMYDLKPFLQERGFSVVDYAIENTFIEDRADRLRNADVILIAGGDRRASLTFRGTERWDQPPSPERIERVMNPANGKPVYDHPGIEVALTRETSQPGETAIGIFSPKGHSVIHRKIENDCKLYRYEPGNPDALGNWADPTLHSFIQEGWHDSEQWLLATADSKYPDIIVQTVELFDSDRTGDIILLASEGWDFRRGNVGGHGSCLEGDMHVPMIITGPGIPEHTSIPVARLIDVTPTILELLNKNGPPMDGRARLHRHRDMISISPPAEAGMK